MSDADESSNSGDSAPNAGILSEDRSITNAHDATLANVGNAQDAHVSLARTNRNSTGTDNTAPTIAENSSAAHASVAPSVSGASGVTTSSDTRKASRTNSRATTTTRHATGGKANGTSLTLTKHSSTTAVSNQRVSRTKLASNGAKRSTPAVTTRTRKLPRNDAALREQTAFGSGVKRMISGNKSHVSTAEQIFGRGSKLAKIAPATGMGYVSAGQAGPGSVSRGATSSVGPVAAVQGAVSTTRPIAMNRGTKGYLQSEVVTHSDFGRRASSGRGVSVSGRTAACLSSAVPQRGNAESHIRIPPGSISTSRSHSPMSRSANQDAIGNSDSRSNDHSHLQETMSSSDQGYGGSDQREDCSTSQAVGSPSRITQPGTVESNVSTDADSRAILNRLPGGISSPVQRQTHNMSSLVIGRHRPGSATRSSSPISPVRRTPTSQICPPSAIPRPISRRLQRVQTTDVDEWTLPDPSSSDSRLLPLRSSAGLPVQHRPPSGSALSSVSASADSLASSHFSVQLPSVSAFPSAQPEISASRNPQPSGRSSALETQVPSSSQVGLSSSGTRSTQGHSTVRRLPFRPTSGRRLSQQQTELTPQEGQHPAETETETIWQLPSRPPSARPFQQEQPQPSTRDARSTSLDSPRPPSARLTPASLTVRHSGLPAALSSQTQASSGQQSVSSTATGTMSEASVSQPPAEESSTARSSVRTAGVFAFRRTSGRQASFRERYMPSGRVFEDIEANRPFSRFLRLSRRDDDNNNIGAEENASTGEAEGQTRRATPRLTRTIEYLERTAEGPIRRAAEGATIGVGPAGGTSAEARVRAATRATQEATGPPPYSPDPLERLISLSNMVQSMLAAQASMDEFNSEGAAARVEGSQEQSSIQRLVNHHVFQLILLIEDSLQLETLHHNVGFGDSYESLWELSEQLGEVKKRGISEEEIAEIPTREFRGLHDEQEECRICLMMYEAPDWLRTLTCKHEFHMACIDQWLLLNATCPICRYSLAKA